MVEILNVIDCYSMVYNEVNDDMVWLVLFVVFFNLYLIMIKYLFLRVFEF